MVTAYMSSEKRFRRMMRRRRVLWRRKIINVVKDLKWLGGILKLAPNKMIWISYDDVADVLYISFEKPQKATDSEQIDDIIIRYRDNKIVGITIINASHYMKKS